MGQLIADLRYGARMLWKRPGFTLIAVLTLALGIGATTAIFSVVNAVLLRPLPYPEAERLLYIGQQYRNGGLQGSGEPKFMFWREHAQSFEAMACYSNFGGASGNLSGGTEAEFVSGARVSEDFFRALGILPALGRPFTHEEDTPGAAKVAILSDGLWRRRFAASPNLLGQTVLLNDQPITVVGIMPPQFRFGGNADLFIPMQARIGAYVDPNAEVVARLKPGVTLAQAQAELKTIAEKYREQYPKQMADGESLGAKPYQELYTEDVARMLWILLGAVGFLLLIACANVANLQLTRAATRQREIAVRKAMGAGGVHIVRQLLTEGVLLALLGGAAGMLVAVWGTTLLVALLPEGMLPQFAPIGVDWQVLLFALGAALVTGLLFGLAPAWQSRQVDVNTALKENAGKGSSARGRLRGALVVTEIALSLVLLVGAGLLLRTFSYLLSVAPGFDPHNVLTFQVALRGERYDTTQEAAAFYQQALERMRNVPGVEAAGITNRLPLDWQFNMPVVFPSNPDQYRSVQFRIVTPEYFQVMRIPVQQGRVFTAGDNVAAAPVAVVNEAFVKRFFPQQEPLAQQLSVGGVKHDPMRQIVGIVGDIKQQSLSAPAPPMVFIPIPQVGDELLATVNTFTPGYFTIRTSVEPLSLQAAMKKELAQVDARLALSRVATMDEIAARSVATERFNMSLLGLFAGLGMLLAAVGIYGVMSYAVAERTNEIGIRMALGAARRDVMALILGQGMKLTLLGVIAGLAASFGLTRLMQGFLFGVSATNPLTFAAVTLLLTLVAALACWWPARRATKVDPLTALRYE